MASADPGNLPASIPFVFTGLQEFTAFESTFQPNRRRETRVLLICRRPNACRELDDCSLFCLRRDLAAFHFRAADLRAANVELRREVDYWTSMHAWVVEHMTQVASNCLKGKRPVETVWERSSAGAYQMGIRWRSDGDQMALQSSFFDWLKGRCHRCLGES